MATKHRVDPITLELAQRWAGFVNQYTPYGLSTVHDEPSWNRWVQQMKQQHDITISSKYWNEYRHAFEDAGGYDAFANIPQAAHENADHATGSGHGSAASHTTDKTTTQSINTSVDHSVPQADLTSNEESERTVGSRTETFKAGDGRDTAEGADQSLRTPPTHTPTADAAQRFLSQPKKETALPETPEATRQREKKEAAEKIVRRFFKENRVNYRRALVQKYLPTDPRYVQFTKDEQRDESLSEQRGE
jgi:hypothetical protein